MEKSYLLFTLIINLVCFAAGYHYRNSEALKEISKISNQSFMHGVLAQKCELPCEVESGEEVFFKTVNSKTNVYKIPSAENNYKTYDNILEGVPGVEIIVESEVQSLINDELKSRISNEITKHDQEQTK